MVNNILTKRRILRSLRFSAHASDLTNALTYTVLCKHISHSRGLYDMTREKTGRSRSRLVYWFIRKRLERASCPFESLMHRRDACATV